MTIKSLRLINFRSHKDALVEFSPGVNIITGENDSGKTNILRGVNLVVNNRPSGEEYRSNWGGDTEVLLDVGGKTVGRHRTDSKNMYTLTGEKEPFKAFGTGVPDIIKQHLNISPVNIAFQLDGPFLLGKNPPDVARYFNNVVDLNVIDSTISNIASTLRGERTALKAKKEDEESLTEKLKAYDWLAEAETGLVELERTQQAIKGLKVDWSDLYGLTKDLKRLQALSQTLDNVTRHSELVEGLLLQDEAIKMLTIEYSGLQSLDIGLSRLISSSKILNQIVEHEKEVDGLLLQAQDIESIKTDLSDLSEKITDLKRLTTEKSELQKIIGHENRVVELAGLNDEVIEKSKKYNSLYDLLEQHDELTKQASDIDDKRAKLESEFGELMPGVCPLCGRGKADHD